MSGKIFKLKPNLTGTQQAVLKDLLAQIEELDVEGFFICVETKSSPDRFLEASSNIGLALIGVIESVKQDIIHDMNAVS